MSTPEEVELWRCQCGKWSHAQRRPVAHQRVEGTLEGEEDVLVWCGPFVRYVAHQDDPNPPADASPRIGQTIPGSERFIGEDPNAGIPASHERHL
jgi:hypothetical protein